MYAHPEPNSFDDEIKDTAIDVLKDAGYAVQLSNLYAMRFKAIVDADDFLDRADEQLFDLYTEQKHASKHGTYTPDVVREQQKVLWADFVIFLFPLWWYSFPAIMKGWIDRVLTYGFAYGDGRSLVGRRAILVATTGGPARVFTAELRDSMTDILDHIQRGILHFCGFQVLPPFAFYGAASATPEQREQYLEQFSQMLRVMHRIQPIDYGKYQT